MKSIVARLIVSRPRRMRVMLPSVLRSSQFLWALTLVVALGCEVSAAADRQSDWEQAKQAAAKEGEVVMYGPHLPFFNKVWEPFQKSYPGIKLSLEPGRGSDHLKRVAAERRAGLYKVDLVMGGPNSLQDFAPGMLDPILSALILPEVTRE